MLVAKGSPGSPCKDSLPSGEWRKIQKMAQSLSVTEKELLADTEKQKGNEEFHAGDMDRAIYYFSRSLAYQARPHVYTNRALAHLRRQAYDEARADCNEALKLDGRHFKAYLRRGIAFLRQHRVKEALADFETAAEIDPSNQELHKLVQEAKDA